MTCVLVVDVHPLFRYALVSFLEKNLNIDSIHEASNYDEALNLLRRGKFDVAIVDISLPGRDGFELVGRMRASYRRLAILVLSMPSAR